jgi:hypothetical protein
MILLNTNIVRGFLKSIAFIDSKRPYTKDILMRIDIKKLINQFEYDEFIKELKELEINAEITNYEYKSYYNKLNNSSEQLCFI